MSKQLYEEALADVKKLKEIAEDNAKKALIEVVSPRIKDLIEAELFREVGEVEDELLLDDEPHVDMVGDVASSLPDHLDPSVPQAMSQPDEEGKVTLDLDALDVQPVGVEFELSNESIKLINPLASKLNSAATLRIESRLFQLGEAVQKFLGASSSLKRTTSYQRKILEMVSEIETTYEYLQESAKNLHDKGVYEGKLEQLYKQLNRLVEQYNMKKNLKSLTEAELTLKLTNVPDEVEDSLDAIGVDIVSDEGDEESSDGGESSDDELDLGGDEEDDSESSEDEENSDELDLGGDEEESTKEAQVMDDDDAVVEIDENMLRREIVRMRKLREAAAAETKAQSWGNGPGEVSSEENFEADDLGDPFVDLELTTENDEEEGVDELAELDSGAEKDEESTLEASDEEELGGRRGAEQVNQQSRSPGATVESVRNRLAREFRVQTEAKKKAGQAKQEQQKAKRNAQAKQQESQQQSKKGQKGKAAQAKQESMKQQKKAKQMSEAYTHYANIFNESVRRADKLRTVLAENRKEVRQNDASTRSTAETSTLRKKLAETNLFNTKLLYCNRLLQNESFTKRQKAEIIERLDEAKNEREVKLVYESLVKTIGGNSRQVTESTQRRVLGSSSQATRSAAAVISENYEADRWAKLAGLK